MINHDVTQATDISGWSICGSSMVLSPGKIAERVLGTPDRNICGDMVLYLFRRFGYPAHGWDDYKSVVSYYLTTPDPEVIVWVKPYGRPGLAFGYGVSPNLDRESMDAEWGWRGESPRTREWEETAMYQRIASAVEYTIRDLLRPVAVRDSLYTILGPVGADADWETLNIAERSPQAGYGIGDFDPVKYANDEEPTP